MAKNIDELLIGLALVALMVISASFIINDAIAKSQLIAHHGFPIHLMVMTMMLSEGQWMNMVI